MRFRDDSRQEYKKQFITNRFLAVRRFVWCDFHPKWFTRALQPTKTRFLILKKCRPLAVVLYLLVVVSYIFKAAIVSAFSPCGLSDMLMQSGYVLIRKHWLRKALFWSGECFAPHLGHFFCDRVPQAKNKYFSHRSHNRITPKYIHF